MIPRDTLAALPLLSDASDPVLDSLASRAVDVRFGTDDVLFSAGSSPRGWFIVIEGKVRVVRSANGRQHVIHTEGAGGTLGEVPLVTGHSHPATAIAAEPTRCALLDKKALEAAMRDAPEIGFLLAKRLALRVRTLVDRLDDRSVRSVRRRLVDFLLEKRSASKQTTISMGMTQNALAEELGTVREVLTRELQSLAKAGLISPSGGGRYEILDVAGLKRMADDA
ncbi:MAG TPA: Crp/Fnr family transcriptional regulator [Gemmatimonadaceae bacterium]|nr:Crp/Fnr family transcriptional regulator [Gemmatimonadaceae bacterium]